MFEIDTKFIEYFEGRLKQCFFYLTDRCNMKCIYCLYKPHLNFQLVEKAISENTAKVLALSFYKLGAIKSTIMGGEPTLYPKRSLLDLIKYLKSELGYEYVRIDTNGMFNSTILYEKDFQLLDEITFSIDCSRKEINDRVRIGGDLNTILRNIRIALNLGYNIQITSTVHKHNIAYIEEFIEFLAGIGIQSVNFHPILKVGVPRDVWIQDVDITPKDWMKLYEEINRKVREGKYPINVRIPKRIVKRSEFEKNPEYYSYCPERLGERILIHPDGILRICALMIGTPYGVGWFDKEKQRIIWNDTPTNELGDNTISKNFTPCPKQRALYFEDFYPLCISFKPEQREIVYDKLGWEKRRK